MEKEQEILKKLDEIKQNALLASKNVLTFEDVVLLTGLSRSHLYKLTCTGQIPHYKPSGKMLYFDRTEIEDWLKQNRVATNQEIDTAATNFVVTGRKGGNV